MLYEEKQLKNEHIFEIIVSFCDAESLVEFYQWPGCWAII